MILWQSTNNTKTQMISFGNISPTLSPVLLNGVTVTRSDKLKLLGVTVQSNMKWDIHVEQVCKKASKCLFMIVQLKRSRVTKRTLLTVYYTLIRSILTYAFASFCNLSAHLMAKMVRIEKIAHRIMGFAPEVTLDKFCYKLCRSLMLDVIRNSNHPLRQLFEERCLRVTRTTCSLRQPLGRKSRHARSFIRFFNT